MVKFVNRVGAVPGLLRCINKTTSDNEGCSSFYESIHAAIYPTRDLFDYFIAKRLKLAFKVNEPCTNGAFPSQGAVNLGFQRGLNAGHPFRSEGDLKLSHYLASAEGVVNVAAKNRCGRFLSPFNIILTPKTLRRNKKGRYSGYKHSIVSGPIASLVRNDIGETPEILKILHCLFRHWILKHKNGAAAYNAYSTCSGVDSVSLPGHEELAKTASSIVVNFKSHRHFNINGGNPPQTRRRGNQIAIPNNAPNPNARYLPTKNTRFFVSQQILDRLLGNPGVGLKIEVTGGRAVHPHPVGEYKIPHQVAVDFIISKRDAPGVNWTNHKNFKSVSVPPALRKYFTAAP